MQSVLSDELLQDLMAVGQVDVLVGLPTQDHADTAPAVARAVIGAFSGPFVRQRTLLLNLDASSQDQTPEAVQRAAGAGGDVLSAQYTLRTIHRLTVPYHGVADRARALRLLFTVGALLRARAVVVLDPTAVSISPADVERWIHCVLVSGADYVRPALPRAWHEGPLLTQFVRPLLGMIYGAELLEPIDTQLACSARFLADRRLSEIWDLPLAQIGVDAFLSAHALSGRFELAQVATSARAHPLKERQPNTAQVLRQVLGTVLGCLAWSFPRWPETVISRTIRLEGSPEPPPAGAPGFDLSSFEDAFRAGVDALSPILSDVLDQSCLERLKAAACLPEVRLDDPLWADTVLAFLAGAIRGRSSPDVLAQMLEPLYLGRVASFMRDALRGGQDQSSQLTHHLEQQRPAFMTELRKREEP